MDYRLQQLERKTIYALREARMNSENTALVCSTDQDSTLLSFLCQKAFFGKIPFRIIKENELVKYKFDELIRPLTGWQEEDVRQYIEQGIKELKSSQTPEDKRAAKDGAKEEVIQRLRDLGYF